MSSTVDQLAEQVLALPAEARAILADRLVESLDPADDSEIHRLWTHEVLRRRDEVRNGTVQTIPSGEALRRVRRSVGQ